MDFELRRAAARDSGAIRRLIREVHINPMGLDWRRFVVAVSPDDMLLGCGQLKPHHDGTVELASIAVVPRRRGMGIARAIIEKLIADAPRPLYLTCRSSLEAFYHKWGFASVQPAEMPAHFRRLWRLVTVGQAVGMIPEGLSVMVLM
jgi:N-acetylglutamate synthase-like GNAT family acetyltransferase